jgi:hypothetical protein
MNKQTLILRIKWKNKKGAFFLTVENNFSPSFGGSNESIAHYQTFSLCTALEI